MQTPTLRSTFPTTQFIDKCYKPSQLSMISILVGWNACENRDCNGMHDGPAGVGRRQISGPSMYGSEGSWEVHFFLRHLNGWLSVEIGY